MKWESAITRLTVHYICGLVSDLVICKHREECGHTWHGMSFLRPGVIKQHKPNTNIVVSRGAVCSVASSYAAMRMVAGSRPVLAIVWEWHIGLALLCGSSGALEYPTTNSCGPINKSLSLSLSLTYPHKPPRRLKWQSEVPRLTAHYLGLVSDLVICKHRKEYGHTWHVMPLLRPGVIKNTQCTQTPHEKSGRVSPWFDLNILVSSASLDPLVLERNVKVIAEALARHIYNLSSSSAQHTDIFQQGLVCKVTVLSMCILCESIHNKCITHKVLNF